MPLERNASIYDTEKWPYVIQLSYILYDLSKNAIMIERDFIIKIPEKVEISEKSIEMHGITRHISEKVGMEIKEALILFNLHLNAADIVIAHNLSFDKRMLIVEHNRLSIKSNFNYERRYYCTMNHGINVCNILAKYNVVHN